MNLSFLPPASLEVYLFFLDHSNGEKQEQLLSMAVSVLKVKESLSHLSFK